MTAQSLTLWCSTRVVPINTRYSSLVEAFRRAIREELRVTIREELRRQKDIKSFAAASGLLKLDETAVYLRMSMMELYRRRHARKIARTDAEKDAAFPAEYGVGKLVRFKRAELDAWIECQRQ